MIADARLLLVDENDDFLDGLSAWISECFGFEVAGIAHSGREALQRVQLLEPDMVLMSMSLPDMTGIDVTRRIKAQTRPPLIILMTFHESAAVRAEATVAGADGCLAKPEIAGDFLDVAGSLWAEHGRRVTGGMTTDKTDSRTPRRTHS